jgi:hypothetical protein
MNRLRITLFAVLFIAVLFNAVPLAFSQTLTTGDVVGVITDTSGAVVPGATVTMKSVATNEARTVTTNTIGEYRFSLMTPGEYILSATSAGMKSNNTRFSVLIGQEQAMNVTLNPQGTSTVVEVNAEAAIVQTENANLTTSYTQAQVTELPMAGGDLTTLAMTVPGVRVSVKGGSGQGNVNANGVPGAAILYTLNGADVMDPYLNLNNSGASNNLLGANEIAEAAVILNAFSAQYGRMAGGQENLIGKSGANAFHGNLVYNYNDAIFNANDWFRNQSGLPRNRAVANEYGGSVSGPVIKNKVFFFFDAEGLRYALPASSNVVLPSKPFQQYILSQINANALPYYQAAFTLMNNAPGYNLAQPVTTGTLPTQDSSGNLGCQTKGTFKTKNVTAPGGGIFGQTVSCAVAFLSANNQLNTEDLMIARGDYNINEKHKLNFRYQYDHGIQSTATSAINPAFNSTSIQPQHAGQMNYTWIISPSIVNSFIGQSSWYSAIFGVADFAKVQSLMPERFTISDGGDNGTAGFTSIGATAPTGRNVGQLQLIDDLSWTKGRHTLKAGINYRYNKVTDTSIASATVVGTYAFSDLTDLSTGQMNSTGKGSAFSQGFPTFFAAHIRVYSLNLYAQDDWAVTKNLKLSYGLRVERNKNPSCTDDCFARLNTQFGFPPYQGGANIPYNQSITASLPTAYADYEAAVWEPRFGFAWSPFGGAGRRAMVIRGGIGLFSNVPQASIVSSVFGNSPQKFSPSVPFGEVGPASDNKSSLAAAIASSNTFQSGFKGGQTLTQIQATLKAQGITFATPSYYSPPNFFKAPKILQWNFEIEQPLTHHDVLSVTYTGNHGYDESLTNADANSFTLATNLYPNGFAGLPTAAPDPRFLTANQVLVNGVSNYAAMISQVRHSFAKGLQGQIGWTWSHALADTAVINPFSLSSGYGPLSFDTRHMVTGDLIYAEPYKFHNKILNAAAGGWTFGAKMFAYTGNPFSVSNSSLAARINSGGGIGNTILSDLLDPSASGTQCTSAAIHVACLTAAQFSTTTSQLDFGNIAPNQFRGPGYFDIDAQVTKNFTLKEKYKFGFGTQFYNLLNHPNFANPSGSVTSAGLGLITATVGPPTSIYGSGQGAIVSGRVMVMQGKFTF